MYIFTQFPLMVFDVKTIQLKCWRPRFEFKITNKSTNLQMYVALCSFCNRGDLLTFSRTCIHCIFIYFISCYNEINGTVNQLVSRFKSNKSLTKYIFIVESVKTICLYIRVSRSNK